MKKIILGLMFCTGFVLIGTNANAQSSVKADKKAEIKAAVQAKFADNKVKITTGKPVKVKAEKIDLKTTKKAANYPARRNTPTKELVVKKTKNSVSPANALTNEQVNQKAAMPVRN